MLLALRWPKVSLRSSSHCFDFDFVFVTAESDDALENIFVVVLCKAMGLG